MKLVVCDDVQGQNMGLHTSEALGFNLLIMRLLYQRFHQPSSYLRPLTPS